VQLARLPERNVRLSVRLGIAVNLDGWPQAVHGGVAAGRRRAAFWRPRRAPLGNPDWVKGAATELNLQSAINPRGRLRKSIGPLNL